MESEASQKLDVPALGERLMALGNLALGLGTAIKAVRDSDDRDQLVEDLRSVSQRLSWLERSTDPNWRPYVEACLANGVSPTTGRKGRRKPEDEACPY